MTDRVRVPAFDELPLLSVPPVLSPHERERLYHPRRRLARLCARDGMALGEHPSCLACGALAGPDHPIARSLDARGRCPGCAL